MMWHQLGGREFEGWEDGANYDDQGGAWTGDHEDGAQWTDGYQVAVGVTAIPLHPLPPPARAPTGMERECQQSDSLADGCYQEDEETAQIRAVFAEIDLDGNGTLSAEEMKYLSVSSRRRDHHFADTRSPSVLRRLLNGEGGAAERQSRRRR